MPTVNIERGDRLLVGIAHPTAISLYLLSGTA